MIASTFGRSWRLLVAVQVGALDHALLRSPSLDEGAIHREVIAAQQIPFTQEHQLRLKESLHQDLESEMRAICRECAVIPGRTIQGESDKPTGQHVELQPSNKLRFASNTEREPARAKLVG